MLAATQISSSSKVAATPSTPFDAKTPQIEDETPLATQQSVANKKKAATASKKRPQQSIETTAASIDGVDGDNFFHEIDKLQAHGVNAADITKFKSAGFCTVLSIIQATKVLLKLPY